MRRTFWGLFEAQGGQLPSSLTPGTLSYDPAWWSGVVGYRHPQFRVTHRVRSGGGKGRTSRERWAANP